MSIDPSPSQIVLTAATALRREIEHERSAGVRVRDYSLTEEWERHGAAMAAKNAYELDLTGNHDRRITNWGYDRRMVVTRRRFSGRPKPNPVWTGILTEARTYLGIVPDQHEASR